MRVHQTPRRTLLQRRDQQDERKHRRLQQHDRRAGSHVGKVEVIESMDTIFPLISRET